MHGDPAVVRRLAATLRGQADEIRTDATRLLAEATAVPWEGAAAEAMRASADRQAAAMEHTAALHDDAAQALLAHARSVEEVQARIAALEREVAHLVGAARHRLSGLLGVVADPLDEVLDRFVPPAPGHVAWLDVDLPGLHLPGLAA
jgi:uncharacterized protein YukE